MKKAEDFRKAFGPATPGFESVVKKTMKELRAQERKPVVSEWRRWRRPVFAMTMALVLLVGIAAVNGTLNPFTRTDRIRSEEESLYTAQPITTVLSMGAGQEDGSGDGAESGASVEENIRTILEEVTPGLSEKLVPINVSSEKNGLRVEVISGYVSEKDGYFVISLEVPENRYSGYYLDPWFESSIMTASGTEWQYIDGNEAEHKSFYLYHPKYSNPVQNTNQICMVGLKSVRLEQDKEIDLLPLLEQYGKTVEGVKKPAQVLRRSQTQAAVPKDLKVLDYTQPLDVPLFGDVCLSGIGWIDGQLHVQYHNTGIAEYRKNGVGYGNVWTVWTECNAEEADYSSVLWDADYDGCEEWEEYVFDVSQDKIEGLELNTDIIILKDVLDDGWMVEIPQEAICADKLELDPYIEEPLTRFMDGWASLDYDVMLEYCTLEWRETTENPRQALMDVTKNAVLQDYRFEYITCGEKENTCKVLCAANIQRPGNMPHTFFKLNIEVEQLTNEIWRINPESLKIWTVAEDIRVEPVESAEMDDQEMFPVNLSCEDKGFRMEVISGRVSGKEASFTISLEDLEGKYADYRWSQNFEVEIPDAYSETLSNYSLNGSETEHRITYRHTQEFNEPVRNGDQTVTVKAPNIRLDEAKDIDLIPLLREHGKTEEGMKMPRLHHSNPDQSELPKDLKVLDYTQPLDIQLFKDVNLSGIGWIDGRLHIQFHNTGRCGLTMGDTWYYAWNTWVAGMDWTGIEYSLLNWDENSDGFPEWTEYVINVKPDEAESLEMVAHITVLKEILTGSWKVEVPLSQIWTETDEEEPAETAEAEEPVRLDRKEDYNQMLLWEFFEYWAQDDVENMVYSLSPEYQNRGQETVVQLRELTESGTPLSYQINSRRKVDGGFVYVCTVELDPGNGEEPRCERFDLLMTRDKTGFDSGIDLASVKERQSTEKDPALETVLLTREAIIKDYLDYFDPGVREKLHPIGMSCEKNGLRMELISGLVDFNEEWILYSLEDVEGRYADYKLDTFNLEDSIGNWQSFSSAPVYRDKTEHKVYFIWNPHYGRPVDTTARDITLRLDCVDSSLKTWANVTELLKQYGENAEGIPVPEETQGSKSGEKADYKVLDYHKPLDIRLLPNTTITGIGWIEDQLHVQICINGMRSNSFIFSETAEGEGWTGKNREVSYSPLRWYGDENEYLEYVFDYKPGDEKTITLSLDTTIAQEIITGPWEFRFPLGTICPDVKNEKTPETEDEAAQAERLEEDFGDISLEDREGKITFDVYANTDVYTKNGIGYALREDGTAEAVSTSILASGFEEIIVPEKVNGHIVTTIGTGAFMDWSVKSVILPDTVQIIRNCAFEDCDKLQYLRIPDGVTSIEPSVFLNCISLTDVSIPDSVTVIEDQAFNSCRSLTKVGIPDGTVEIGNYAFVGCESLTFVTLPEGLNVLGEYAFFRCAGLETIEVPGGLSFLGQGAFKNCTVLKTARLQEGITLLNPDLFAGCTALETVDLPGSLSSISDRAFKACGSLKKLVLPEGLRYIGRAAFMDCTGLEEVVIPESVIDMEENVFKGCTGLTCTVTNGSCAMRYCEENGIPYVVK